MGLLRLWLAGSVALWHLGPGFVQPWLYPSLAVSSFYAVSGFYMQLLVVERKTADGSWIAGFYASRALRLFPLYYIFMLAGLACLPSSPFFSYEAVLGKQVLAEGSAGTIVFYVLSNLFIFGQDIGRFGVFDPATGGIFFVSNPLAFPPELRASSMPLLGQSWTVALELWFYLLAPFLLVRRAVVIALIVLASLVLRIGIYLSGIDDLSWWNSFFPSELAVFLCGSLACRVYLRKLAGRPPDVRVTGAACVAAAAIFLYGRHYMSIHNWSASFAYATFIVLAVPSLPLLFYLTHRSRIDRIAGELSYPIYLSHLCIGSLWLALGVSAHYLGAVSLVTCILVGLVLVRYVEHPLNRLRHRLSSSKPAPAAPSPPLAPPPVVSRADAAMQEGLAHFRRRDFDAAYASLSEHLLLTDRADLISRKSGSSPCVFDAETPDRAIGDYLERRMDQWKDGRIPKPRFLQTRTGPVADPKGKRLLLVFSRYICNDSRFMQNDMIDHFLDTAINAGITTDVFFVDDCSYPRLAPTPRDVSLAALDRLKAHVAKTRPDFMFFDAQYIGEDITLNAGFIAEIRNQYGVRTIGAMCDAWDEVCVPMANYWLPAVDAMYHFAPGSPMETGSSHPEKLVWSGYPTNRARFWNATDKDVSISFSGTYDFGNRAFWISTAARTVEKLGIPNARLSPHDRQTGAAEMGEYAAIMRHSRTVLNLPARHNGKYAVTGRIWQALHCGALVLEEHTALTEAYFVPHVHYVPFRSAEELARLIRFFHENHGYSRLIGDCAAAFMGTEYSEARIWSDILNAA
jgi:peptidoglycan/LPS O-acetylase OafA/YrhL